MSINYIFILNQDFINLFSPVKIDILKKAESLNKGTLSETGPSTLEAYRQQWTHEDLWEMPNPFIGYNGPYYDKHVQHLK